MAFIFRSLERPSGVLISSLGQLTVKEKSSFQGGEGGGFDWDSFIAPLMVAPRLSSLPDSTFVPTKQ